MTDASRLTDIAEICDLKHRYARLIDTKQWDEFVELFTDDVIWDYVGLPRTEPDDPQEMYVVGTSHIAAFSAMQADIATVHHVVMPEIRFTGPDQAEATWSLHDLLFLPTNRFEGWGHYFDEYVRIDGHWKISKLVMRRLKIVETWYDDDREKTGAPLAPAT